MVKTWSPVSRGFHRAEGLSEFSECWTSRLPAGLRREINPPRELADGRLQEGMLARGKKKATERFPEPSECKGEDFTLPTALGDDLDGNTEKYAEKQNENQGDH